jgi:hypothetical protein
MRPDMPECFPTLLEKMAHFSSVITYGAGRSSQWAKAFVIFSSSGKGKLEAILIHSRSSVAMVQISATETVFRIWSGSDQKGLGQTKKSGSDPKVLNPTGSGSLTLSRTQKGLFKNLCDQKNGRIFLKISKKSVYSGPKFVEDKDNF